VVSIFSLLFIQQFDNSGKQGFGFWRASRYVQVNGNEFIDGAAEGISFCEDASGAAAGTYGDHQNRFWGLAVDVEQPRPALLVDGARHQQHVGMPDTSYQKHPKTLHIETGCKAVEQLYVTVIARCSGKMKEPQ